MKKLIQTAGYGRIVSTQSSAKQRNLSICKCINYESKIDYISLIKEAIDNTIVIKIKDDNDFDNLL